MMIEDAMKGLAAFARIWNLNLEIQHDVDLGGRRVHCMSVTPEEKKENTRRVFFWVMPEEEKLCLYVPAESTVGALAEQYGVELEELSWEELTEKENMKPVCMKIDQLDYGNVLRREFIQHMMGARAEQFGLEPRANMSGSTGGCGGE